MEDPCRPYKRPAKNKGWGEINNLYMARDGKKGEERCRDPRNPGIPNVVAKEGRTAPQGRMSRTIDRGVGDVIPARLGGEPSSNLRLKIQK